MNRLFQVSSTAKPLSKYSFCRNILRCELYTVTFHVNANGFSSGRLHLALKTRLNLNSRDNIGFRSKKLILFQTSRT